MHNEQGYHVVWMDLSETAPFRSSLSRPSQKQFTSSIHSFRVMTASTHSLNPIFDHECFGGVVVCCNRCQHLRSCISCEYATFWRAVSSRTVTGGATLSHTQDQSSDTRAQSVALEIYSFAAAQRNFCRARAPEAQR